MRISTLNGMNGLSRVNIQSPMQGLSRVTLDGYSLNYCTLNAIIDYVDDELEAGRTPTFDGFQLNGKAERQARRAARAQRREDRKLRRSRRQEARTERAETRGQRREERREKIRDIAQKVGQVGEKFINEKLGLGPDDIADIDYTEVNDFVEDRGLFGPPKFNPLDGKWWGSNRVPMWQKIGVGALTAFAADQALNKGKITNPITGINGGKPRK